MAALDALQIRKRLGRRRWGVPQPFGLHGWSYIAIGEPASIIVTLGVYDDQRVWLHASIARSDRMPDYADLVLLHHAAFGDAWAYQVFAPASSHVDIHEHALHLWGLADGTRALPDFGKEGTI